MSWVAVAVVGGSVVGGVIAGEAQKSAAEEASGAQIQASQTALQEQQRQFDEIRSLLSPFVEAGETALTAQQALIGLGGDEAQQQAIQRIEESPQFQAITQQGEEAILQRAAATGGLRGGNVQRALGQFRPQVLSNLIEQQFSRLGGLSRLGQSSAAGQAQLGQQTSAGISNLLQQQGQTQAGLALARGQASLAPIQGFTQGLGILGGLAGTNKF